MKKEPTVEITRFFAYKLGQPNYSSVDFSCSVRQECEVAEQIEVSDRLYRFAKSEVQKSITEFVEAVAAKEKAERDAEKEKQNARAAKIEEKGKAKESAQLDKGAEAKDDIEIVPDKTN